MKKLIALVIVAVMLLGMMPMVTMAADGTTIYLKPNSNWTQGSAYFAARFWTDGVDGDAWAKMTDTDGDGYYECVVPNNHTKVIFCRMNPNGTDSSNNYLNWTNKWDQSGDQTIPTDGKNCFAVNDGQWNNATGAWSTYTPSGSGNQGGGQTEQKYYVTGDLAGGWNPAQQELTNNGDGTYTYTATVTDAGTYQYKVTNGTWDTSWPSGSDNYSVTTTGGGEILVKLDMNQSGGVVTVTGSCIGEPSTELDYQFISVAGNGGDKSGWMNGKQYDPTATVNKMTETSEDVWEITFKSVPVGEGYDVKFAVDGAWTTNWGGTFTSSGTATDASVNGINIVFDLSAVSNVTLKLDLTNYNATTKQGAKFTITIVPVPVVSFNYNYAGAPEAPAATVDANGKVSVPASIPTRAGWALVGWYKNVDCTGNAVNFDTDTFTENTTLFAKWSENEHTVKLHNNDGTDAVTSVATSAEKVQLPANNPERANYTFKEWNTKADGTGTKYVGGESISDDLDLYAIWEQKPTYTVSFDLNYEGATGAPEAKSTIDGKIELPAASRTGYTFNGWYTAKTEGTKVDNDKVYEANTTLYAQWTKVEYVTVHASVPETWTTAFVYAWNTGAGSNEAWPGAPMTKGTDGWFTAQVPVGYGNLIIAEKDGGEQTKDLTGINQTATEIWVTLTEKEGDKYKADVTYPSDINTDPSEYYLHGYINGADVTGTTYKFVDGKVTVNLTAESYVFVGTDIGSNFMTDGWLGKEVKEATLATDYATGDKLYVPVGNVTFTLVVNDDGTVKLSYAVAAPEGGNQGGNEGGNQGGSGTGTPEPPTGSLIINAKVPAAWASAYLYAWNTGDDVMASWPGTAMTKGDDGWYTIEIPAGYKNIIVAEKNGGEQTVDLSIANVTKNEIWVTLGEKNADGKYPATIAEDEEGEEVVAPPEVKEVVVYAKVPADWSAPYVYAWSGSGNNASWPGVAMTKGENGWWYAKVPASVENVIISNKGTPQTVDLKLDKLMVDVWVSVAAAGADGKYTATMQYSSPATGDTAVIAPVAILMVLSVTGMAVLTVGKKKFF